MLDDFDDSNIDINQLIVKPLYFGLVTNIMIPGAILFLCYYLFSKGTGPGNSLGDFANTFFYILCALAVAQATFLVWWRGRQHARPMIRSERSFEADLSDGIMKVSRPVFIAIAAISGYGLLYYFLTGRFDETLIMVVFSFVVFQVIRPRHSQVISLIKKQKNLIKNGEFLTD